jgi:tetratricopeptide (TPR) repeat protein
VATSGWARTSNDDLETPELSFAPSSTTISSFVPTMSDLFSDNSGSDELDLLLEASARHALEPTDGHEFVEWFAQVIPILCPQFVAGFVGSEAERSSAFHSLGRLLWNRMPLPENHFRPRPLPKPERNAPCPCGSGRKYKHCCAGIELQADPFEGVSLLRYVLGQYPRTRLKTLPLTGFDLEELAHIGNEWCRKDRADDAEALLEHIFEDVDRLDERAQYAFDVLADCYDHLRRPKKKERLIERVAHARNPTLRSAALHRRITILADHGERAEAWRQFAEAQRHEPDNPMLATLELTMLLGEKDYDRMRERGQFWMARLARDRNQDFSDLIGHIRELIADPVEASLKYVSADRPGLSELRRLLATPPPIECHYTLERDEDRAGLVPSAELEQLVAEWRRNAEVFKPTLTDLRAGDEQAWERLAPGIPWLKGHPLAWQSFDILDDLALAVQEVPLMAGDEALLAPLVERAYALLRLVLDRNGGNDCTLPWVFLDNRPALRLMVALYYLRRDQSRLDDAFAIARWLVTQLNPNDNHGLREELTRLCLERGEAQGALDVCDRYPDDAMLGMLFNRPLALFLLARHSEAESALREAMTLRPHVAPMLLAANPKPPRSDGRFVRVGGKREAWLYRTAHHTLWERSGALTWARGVRAEPGTGRRR